MQNNYSVDKVQLFEQQQNRALEKFTVIEKNCELGDVAFLNENYNFDKIHTAKNDIDFSMTLSVCLSRICVLSGIKNDVDTLNADDITKSIVKAYSDLTIEEVYKAFELERYGVYDEKTEHYQLFNADYVTTILKKYKNWKLATKVQHNISPVNVLPEITESEKEQILIKGIVRVFDEFKENGSLPEPNNYIFDALYERKIIPDATTPQIQAYYQQKYAQASNEVHKELKTSNLAVTKNEKREIQTELQKIIDNNSDKVAARVKKIILAEWFSKLIKNGKHISEYLNKPS